jgi:sec-independent protein translocase protein TatC
MTAPGYQQNDEKEDEPDASLAPLMTHVAELRYRLMLACGMLLVTSIGAYVYAEQIYGFLVRPLADAMGPDGTNRLIYTDLTEAFFTYMKVALWAGLFISFPVILAQIWLFVAPGLYKKERTVFFGFLVATPLLFYMGGGIVYAVILPMAWRFFLSFQSDGSETVLPIMLEARVSDYLDLVMTLMFAFGVAFQLPVLMLLLARAGMITADTLVKYRKWAIILAFVIAAPLTPPDIMSQTALAIPLILLYELSILLIRAMNNAGKMTKDVAPSDDNNTSSAS